MVTFIHDIPGAHVAQFVVGPHAATTATESVHVFQAPFTCKLRAVQFVAAAAITGADTNYTSLTVAHGASELYDVDYTSGINQAADIAFGYVAASPRPMAAGDRITLTFTKEGSGLAIPRLLAIVTYEGA